MVGNADNRLDREIPKGYEFDAGFLRDRAIGAGGLAKARGGIAFRFLFAHIVHVAAKREAEQVRGFEALAVRKNRREDNRSECKQPVHRSPAPKLPQGLWLGSN